jgi:hypothetical protein
VDDVPEEYLLAAAAAQALPRPPQRAIKLSPTALQLEARAASRLAAAKV